MSGKDDVSTIIQNISSQTEKTVKEMYANGKLVKPITGIAVVKNEVKPILNDDRANVLKSIEVLKDIMENGSKEFEQKAGRPMTYSEMRAMFG